MFKFGFASAMAAVAFADGPFVVESSQAINDDDTIVMDQVSGLSRMTGLTDATYGYPNPAVKGEKVMFNLEGIWNEYDGNHLDHVTFDFYQDGKIVKSETFKCGAG